MYAYLWSIRPFWWDGGMKNNIFHVSQSADNVKHQFCPIFASHTNHWVAFFFNTFYFDIGLERRRTINICCCCCYSTSTLIIPISKQHLVESSVHVGEGETHGETGPGHILLILTTTKDVVELLVNKRQSFWIIIHSLVCCIIDIKDTCYSPVMSPNFSCNHIELEARQDSWYLRQKTWAVPTNKLNGCMITNGVNANPFAFPTLHTFWALAALWS